MHFHSYSYHSEGRKEKKKKGAQTYLQVWWHKTPLDTDIHIYKSTNTAYKRPGNFRLVYLLLHQGLIGLNSSISKCGRQSTKLN